MRRVLVVTLVAAAVGLGVGVVPRLLGVSPYLVTSGSMVPTIAVGQRVVVTDVDDDDRGELVPGDVVLFHYPPGTTGLAIKRIAATGGDTVAFDEHSITVNGHRQAIEGTPTTGPDAHKPVAIVPADAVFLLGDNTPGSIDSRSFGPLPRSEIVGHVRFGLPPTGWIVAGLATSALLLGAVAARLRRRRTTRED